MLQKMREIVQKLNKYSFEYYELDSPTVSDAEYDELYDKLISLEKQSGTVFHDSPSRRVGGRVKKGFSKHKHLQRLYSLDKALTLDEVNKFCERGLKAGAQKFCIEYKFDGLTVCLTYKQGVFVSAATRGNGSVGENVTEQLLAANCFPLEIDYMGTIEVQGEAVISLTNFEKYNKDNTLQLKNARNAAAGAVRNLNYDEAAKRGVEIIFYNVNYIDDLSIDSQTNCVQFLKRNNFKTSSLFETYTNANEIYSAIERIENSRTKLDYLTDGAVIKIDEYSVRQALGYTEKAPRWALAFKFNAEQLSTKIKKVIWQVGRTGKLTPLAIVEPVNLGGATVQRATLNNYGDILRKNVKIGSIVNIRRSNDVIPEILGATLNPIGVKEILPPAICPECAQNVSQIGANLFCTNYFCQARIILRLVHFCSKDAAAIDGLSEKTLMQLYLKLGVDTPHKLFLLTAQDLQNLEGFKQKKIENLLKSIQNAKNIEFYKFIYALGIEGVGIKTAKDLAAAFDLNGLILATVEELKQVSEVGDIISSAASEYFKDKQNLKEIELLTNYMQINYKKTNSFGKLLGQNIVLTGTLENFSRSAATKIIEELGGVVSSAVTKQTTLVVAGENAGSKLEKAKQNQIKIIDESEFSQLIKS